MQETDQKWWFSFEKPFFWGADVLKYK